MEENKMLMNNGIKKFILRFDIKSINKQKYNFKEIVNGVSPLFDRVETRNHTNYLLDLQSNEPNIAKEEHQIYVLVDETKNQLLTFFSLEQAIVFETNYYKNKDTYQGRITEILNILFRIFPDIRFKRIGMRFINYFECKDLPAIKKIVNLNIYKIINQITSKPDINRALSQEEYNFGNSKLRLIYGIINKFYPSVITNFDLTIDIDSFDDSPQLNPDCYDSINELNHKAYDKFIQCMDPNFLLTLK